MDGVSPLADENTVLGANRSSTLSGYIGASHTAKYRHVGQGYGKRGDFTLENVKDKSEFSHDYSKMGTLQGQLQHMKDFSTKKNDTFGTPYNEKSMLKT